MNKQEHMTQISSVVQTLISGQENFCFSCQEFKRSTAPHWNVALLHSYPTSDRKKKWYIVVFSHTLIQTRLTESNNSSLPLANWVEQQNFLNAKSLGHVCPRTHTQKQQWCQVNRGMSSYSTPVGSFIGTGNSLYTLIGVLIITFMC